MNDTVYIENGPNENYYKKGSTYYRWDANVGAAAQTDGRKTQATRGVETNTNQGGKHETIIGEHSVGTTGNNTLTAGSMITVCGSDMYKNGNTAAANKALKKSTALQAQNCDDKDKNFSIPTMLSNVARSIKNATVTLDTDGGLYEPTGKLWFDLGQLVVYYKKQLMNFTLQATLKRILLAIKNELERMAAQIQETVKKFNKVVASIADLDFKNLKKLFTSPAKENKAGNSTLTNAQITNQVLGDKNATNIQQAEANTP